MPEDKPIRVALAGNPNAGKTTVFNALTGARQHVANYPGVTVEKRQGRRRHAGRPIDFVDLPGIYGLTAYTQEEVVARDFCLREAPDVVVDIVDASNLERNLYLTVQFMELAAPLVVVLNMSDVARDRGISIDAPMLSRLLGVPVLPMVATKGQGLDELLDAVIAAATHRPRPVEIHYGAEIDEQLAALEALLPADVPRSACPTVQMPETTRQEGAMPAPQACFAVPRRWLALKLLEGDALVTAQVIASYPSRLGQGGTQVPGEGLRPTPAPNASDPTADQLRAAVARAQSRLHAVLGDTSEILIADRRYGFISGACREAVRTTVELRHDLSDRIDGVVTHQLLGPLIFLAAMFAVFSFVFALGNPLKDQIAAGCDWLAAAVAGLWPAGSAGTEYPLRSLLVDGVIGGVGAVVSFLPNIMLLFLALAFLEDSGYLARAAFIMDRVMHRLGLHGKSFVPMLMGFGCSVPAILATRTLDTRRDRLTTMLVLPLMSCSARLPIYLMILPAFFPLRWQAPMLWLVYLAGIFAAVLLARLLRRTILRGETAEFVLEMPPYRMPTLRGVALHTWERSKSYVRKAGTVILFVSIIMWFLTSYPKPAPQDLAGLSPAESKSAAVAHSYAGRLGHAVAPAVRPLGFDWRITTALIPAFTAKEVFVSQMGIVFNLGEVNTRDKESVSPLTQQIRAHYPPLTGLCLILFCLMSSPCVATIAVTWRESGHIFWPALQLFGLSLLAYAVTFTVYQLGSALHLGTQLLR
jgi:ferrous iron transport protein B